MNTKTILVTLSVITGIVGIVLIANSYTKTKEDKNEDTDPAKEPKPSPASLQPVRKAQATPSVTQNRDGIKAMVETPVAMPEPPQTFVNKDETKEIKSRNSDTLKTETETELQLTDDSFPLKLGSRGPRVERLQVWLMRNYGRWGKIDGIFGRETEAELKKRLNKTMLDEGTYQRYRMGKHVNEQVIIR